MPQYEVQMPEGVKWIGSAANPAAAIRAALAKRYGATDPPDPLTVTVSATKGGAVLVPPQ